jgi:hypothetical protein
MMSTGEKILAWGAAGITAVLVTFGIIEAVKSKPPSTTPTTTGTTMSILLTPGNLGIVALPAGATLIVGAPQGGSVGNVSFSAAGYKVAAQTGTAVSIQASSTTPAVAQATITWVDATNAAQSSTVQIVPELATTQIGLSPGTMPNVWLPASSSSVTGSILLVPPSQVAGNTQLPVVNSGSVSGSSVTGTQYPPATGSPGGSYGLVAAANGASTVTVNWTDGTGASQTSTLSVSVLAG